MLSSGQNAIAAGQIPDLTVSIRLGDLIEANQSVVKKP